MFHTATLLLVLAATATTITAAEPEFAVVGYLPSYSISRFDSANAAHYTDIILFSLEPNADASIDTSGVPAKAVDFTHSLADTHSHLRLAVSLGGWGKSKEFATIAASPELRATLIKNITNFCESNQLTGIDYDWEHPKTAEERDSYTALINDTTAAFHPRGWRVTAAITAWQAIDSKIAERLDRLHLMAYDYGGKHSTFQNATTAVDSLIAKKIPANKICLGIPFYGRQIDDRTKALSYANIVKRHPPASPATDESAGYYFNGPATVAAKTNLALSRKLCGVMIWEIGQDAPASHSLAAEISAAIHAASHK